MDKHMKLEYNDPNLGDSIWAYEDNPYVAHVDELGRSWDSLRLDNVEIPEWAAADKEYKPIEAKKLGSGGNSIIAITYSPTHTLGMGYAKVYLVESKTNKPFAHMEGIWQELHNRSKSMSKSSANVGILNPMEYNYRGSAMDGKYLPSSNITISPTGELRNAFGIPSFQDLYGVIKELYQIYREWRVFPNAETFDSVRKLRDAKNKVYAMNTNASILEEEISSIRTSIQERQNKIADLEGQMNKLYEDGAEAMNLLEEHGINIDLNNDSSNLEQVEEWDELDRSLSLIVPFVVKNTLWEDKYTSTGYNDICYNSNY